MSEKIFITGASGQDGQFLVDYIVTHTTCEVFGFSRRFLDFKHPRFQYVPHALSLEYVRSHKPDYFINLSALSNPKESFDDVKGCYDANLIYVIEVLEKIKRFAPDCRFLNAGSIHEFCSKKTPYSLSKSAAREVVSFYRNQYGIRATQVSLSNHISHLRGEEFVDGKIIKGAKRISRSIKDRRTFEPIKLDNIGAVKDWSHAKDIIEGIWLIVQKLESEIGCGKDYFLCSGKYRTVKKFVEQVFDVLSIEGTWIKEGGKQLFVLPNYLSDFCDIKSQVLVTAKSDAKDFNGIYGNSLILKEETEGLLNWRPKYSFEETIKEILTH